MANALEINNLKRSMEVGSKHCGNRSFGERRRFLCAIRAKWSWKSTTIGIITSLVNKTSGKVNVFGYDLDKDLVRAKQQIGLVPQEFNFNPFETVQQIVVNQAGYYGVSRKEAMKRSENI